VSACLKSCPWVAGKLESKIERSLRMQRALRLDAASFGMVRALLGLFGLAQPADKWGAADGAPSELMKSALAAVWGAQGLQHDERMPRAMFWRSVGPDRLTLKRAQAAFRVLDTFTNEPNLWRLSPSAVKARPLSDPIAAAGGWRAFVDTSDLEDRSMTLCREYALDLRDAFCEVHFPGTGETGLSQAQVLEYLSKMHLTDPQSVAWQLALNK